jgi:hypothetical protein
VAEPLKHLSKLRRLTVERGAPVNFSRKVSLETLTTRRHHPGRHRIDVLVNGISHPLIEVEVRT